MSASARLFAGIAPPGELALALHARAALILAPCARELRFYAADELHLTLWFAGSRPRGEIEPLGAALVRECAGLRAARLELRGGGAFPSFAKPRVVWAGAAEAPGSEGRLEALASAAARALGGELELPFRPHLTLARPRAACRPKVPAELAQLALPELWVASELVLFESVPGARPRYLARARVPLAP